MAVYEPKVTAVTLTPNPANINSAFLISAAVSDVEVVMYAVGKICGAAICGEGVNPVIYKEVAS